MKTESLVKVALLSIFLGSLIIGFNDVDFTSFTVARKSVHESYKNIKVYFCPRDNCSLELEKIIEDETICAFYDLNLENIENKLIKTQYRLVTHNRDDIEIAHRENKGYQLMHNKFCVSGNNIATGSFNPTHNGNYKNNNNLIIIKSDYLSKNYNDEFNELWDLNFGDGNEVKYKYIEYGDVKITNLFCPEDSCKENVLRELDKSEESIYFMLFSFTDKEIANKLIEKNKIIDVKGIMEKQRINMEYNMYKILRNNSINVIPDNNKYIMHHKVFIIDNKTVITGSYNPTSSGNKRNDENILIIESKDIAEKYLGEFNYLWNN